MKKFKSIALFIIGAIFLIGVYSAQAKSLNWDPVESTPDCTIAGYIVHYGTVEGEYTKTFNSGNVTRVSDIEETLNLVPGETVYFVVNAYSDKDLQGPFSNVCPYTYEVSALPEDNIGPKIIYIPGPVQQIIINN